LRQPQLNLKPPPESQEEPDNALVFINATQIATPSEKRSSKRRRADSDKLANWRDEQDPAKRRRRANAYHRRQSNKRRRTQTDAQNEASTEEALEVQQAEYTMDQAEDNMDQATRPDEG
jgi:hypothetical protein